MAGFDWPELRPDPGGRPGFILTRCELAVRRPEVRALALDLRLAIGLAAHQEAGSTAGQRGPRRAGRRLCRRRPGRRPGSAAGAAPPWRRCVARRPRAPRARHLPPPPMATPRRRSLPRPTRRVAIRAGHGRRPRPHRHRLAVAAAGDHPQVRPHLRHRRDPDGGLPGVPLRLLRRPAPGLDRGALPRAVRPHRRAGAHRPVRAGGRHVGRGRLQPGLGRGARPPDRARQALLRRPVRRGVPGAVAARRLRLHRRPPPDHGRRRRRLVHLPEAVVERDQPLPVPHVLVGGQSTAPGCGPTSRRPTPTTASCRSRQLFRSARAARSIYPYGHGDGGGGPTREMLEAARRVNDLDGAPTVALEPPAAFFAAVEADPAPLPVWAGDLYLEKHRGTFTSQAGIKRGNRKGEAALQAAELWTAAVSCVQAAPAPPPVRSVHARELEAAWRLLLTNQFHDILPGSSIRWVAEEAEAAAGRRRSAGPRRWPATPSTPSPPRSTRAASSSRWWSSTPRRSRRRRSSTVGGRPRLVDVPPLGWTTIDAATGHCRASAHIAPPHPSSPSATDG